MTENPTPFPTALPAAPAPSAVRRIAVLGLGRAGLAYAAAIATHPQCELAGLIDARADLRAFAKAAGFTAPIVPNYAKLRAGTGADAMVLCAPAAERVALLESLADEPAALLIDGLPAPHAEGADRLAAVLARRRAPVACATPLLLHPLFAHAAQAIAAGAIGTPGRVRASVYVSRVFSSGAAPEGLDVLEYAMAPLFALLDALFGAPLAVRASGHKLYADRLDELHVEIAIAAGIEAGVDGSWSVPGYPYAAFVVEAEGEHGRLLVSDDALEVDLVRPCSGFEAGVTRRVFADEPDDVVFDAGDASRALARWLQTPMGSDALDARRALRVSRMLSAVRRSIAEGGVPQELSA